MAATGLQINWLAVGFTPAGGSLVSFVNIDGVSIDRGGETITYGGDADRYPVVGATVYNQPRVTVSSANVAQFQAIANGTSGVWTGTLKDAKLATGGDIVFTFTGIIDNVPVDARKREFAGTSLSIRGISADGATNPLSFVLQ